MIPLLPTKLILVLKEHFVREIVLMIKMVTILILLLAAN